MMKSGLAHRICPKTRLHLWNSQRKSSRPRLRKVITSCMQKPNRSIIARVADDLKNAPLGDLLLTNRDFPDNYRNMAHPEDYQLLEKPLPLQLFYNIRPRHLKILCRVSFKVTGGYYPVSFVGDTGAPGSFYLNEKVMIYMTRANVIKADDLGTEYIDITKGRFTIHDTPAQHAPANIMGLSVLKKLRLVVDDNLEFLNHLDYF